MNRLHLLAAVVTLAVAACDASGRTETTQTSSVEQTEGGGEIHRTSAKTVETANDGSETIDRTETTRTETPAPSAP